MLLVITAYVVGMHLIFGSAYDAATIDQVHRTFGMKAAPGLNYSPLLALEATWNRYWMFLVTIIMLLSGTMISSIRYVQNLFRRREITQSTLSRNISQSTVISWALSGVLFAFSISLKDPHYMILWIVPLYLVLAQELGAFIQRWNWYIFFPWSKAAHARALSFLMLFCLLICIGNTFGFRARFVDTHEDALQQAELYIDENVPSTALVLTQNYIGVDLVQPFLDITLVDTPLQIARHHVSYMALYWSTSAQLSPLLGPVNHYCPVKKTFSGFKDNVSVCQVNHSALQALITTKLFRR